MFERGTSEKPEVKRARDAGGAFPLHCAACRTRITTEAERCERAGAHAHRFTNPLGLTFDIGLFSEAPGCTLRGEPSLEHTWFPGHVWTIAVCANCHEHLGWRFRGEGEPFFGLILDRLI